MLFSWTNSAFGEFLGADKEPGKSNFGSQQQINDETLLATLRSTVNRLAAWPQPVKCWQNAPPMRQKKLPNGFQQKCATLRNTARAQHTNADHGSTACHPNIPLHTIDFFDYACLIVGA
jgi:hypothetical protein